MTRFHIKRFEKQLDDERKLFEQQKNRLIKEFEEEKTKIGKDIQAQKSNYDASREKLKSESMDLLHHVKTEFKEKLKQKELKHQVRRQIISSLTIPLSRTAHQITISNEQKIITLLMKMK